MQFLHSSQLRMLDCGALLGDAYSKIIAEWCSCVCPGGCKLHPRADASLLKCEAQVAGAIAGHYSAASLHHRRTACVSSRLQIWSSTPHILYNAPILSLMHVRVRVHIVVS